MLRRPHSTRGGKSTVAIAFGCLAAGAVLFGADPADTRLFDAIRADDVHAIRVLLKNSSGANVRDSGGVPAVVYAAAFCSADCVRVVLDAGADARASTPSGATALMWGAGDTNKLALLLDHGARTDVQLSDGTTALVAAVRWGNLEGMRLLLTRDGRPSAAKEVTELLRLAGGDRARIRPVLSDAGLDLTGLARFGVPTLANQPLSNARAIRSLLDLGASPNPRGRFPVLGLAGFQGQVETAQLLLERGADPNATGQHGVTPLMMAAGAPHPNSTLLRLLIERGGDVHARDENGRTALDWARTQGDTPAATVLGNTVATLSDPALPPAVNSRPLRSAITNAVKSVASISAPLYERRKCVACHHQMLPLTAMTAARTRGIEVAAGAIAHPAHSIEEVWNGRREDLMVGREVAGGANELTYGLFALADAGIASNQATDAAVVDLLTLQRDDGSWVFWDTRPPQADNSPIPFTAMAIRGLQAYAPPALRRHASAAIERARTFLRTAALESTQDEAFRLLGMVWARESRKEITAQARRVIDLQRESGGWAQLPTMTPDAYATGEALYALHVAGTSPRNAVYDKGVRYLIRTQLDDGTWWVRSRAFGFQPYFETGFPHGGDQFISASATAWAIMALSPAL